jgi:hypothetical protein
MSRVFEAMRRKSPSSAEQPGAPHDVFESFPLREVTLPAAEPQDILPPPPVAARQQPVQAPENGRPAELPEAPAVKGAQSDKATRSFLDLIREIARDEAEQHS